MNRRAQQHPHPSASRHRAWWRTSLLIAAIVFCVGACDDQEEPDRYVARVGERFLLEGDIRRAMDGLPSRQDSLDARRQFVEQWITTELLYQEALRRGLAEEESVQKLLEDGERAVLVNALVGRIYEENASSPSSSDVNAYFERHKQQLQLREPYVLVRYVPTRSRPEAEEARRAMQQSALADRDSVWVDVLTRLGTDQAAAREISSNYLPESRLFAGQPVLHQALSGLAAGQTAPIIESDSLFHVIQLAERVAQGTTPQPAWIGDELLRRLVLQARKQLYARQVQRLRNEALAREELEIR